MVGAGRSEGDLAHRNYALNCALKYSLNAGATPLHECSMTTWSAPLRSLSEETMRSIIDIANVPASRLLRMEGFESLASKGPSTAIGVREVLRKHLSFMEHARHDNGAGVVDIESDKMARLPHRQA